MSSSSLCDSGSGSGSFAFLPLALPFTSCFPLALPLTSLFFGANFWMSALAFFTGFTAASSASDVLRFFLPLATAGAGASGALLRLRLADLPSKGAGMP
ncbi:hypothetical protein IWZ03DRAFT_367013 [Phyllosticta citriasiana]|uniref:Uncharacterized protein n=1 Tax=Phyllosticta citriasiana TaxID=595635 RepID=A0ABR1KZW4_9PEZI